MKINENKIIFDASSSPSQQKKMNTKHILLSQSNNDFLPSRQKRKYFNNNNRKSSIDKRRRINLNTQPILSKNNNKTQEEIEQQQSRQQHVKSGFIYSRKQILSTQKINHFKKTMSNSVTNSSVVFKRRVHSESKVQQISKTMKQQNSFYGNEKQSISKINFAKKLIQDLKKATFINMKPRNNHNHRYQVIKENNGCVSKSFDNTNHNIRVSQQSRQRLMQKSIQKLKPSFNINQVKFYSTKKILRKRSFQQQQSQQQQKKQSMTRNIIKSRLSISKVAKQKQVQSKQLTLSQIASKQILLKVINHTQQPLKTYSKFIKGSIQQKQYRINVNYLLQYSKKQQTQKEQTNHQRQRGSKHSYITQIDFSALKLLSSIYLCIIQTLNKLLQHGRQSSSSKKQQSNSNNNKDMNQQIQVIKQYIQVYFHTYSRMKAQYIICQVIFEKLKNRLYTFFILQRVMFYYLHQNVQQFMTTKMSKTIHDDIPSIIKFVQMSEEINKTLLNMLHQQIASFNHNVNLVVNKSINKNNKVQDDNETYKKGEKIVDTFRTLRLMKEIEKRSYKLRDIVENVVIKDCSKQDLKCNENIIKDAVLSLMALAQHIEKDQNTTTKNTLQIYQLQQYFNWTLMSIPPLFYLPPQPLKHYTLVIDLDGTLIYYDQQTKILKYRPYMDKFLTTMKKYFQLVLFSSHPKERTDIIVQQIQRDEQMFQYRLYRQHMVFQQGGLRKNVGYLGRSVQRVILIDDEQRNTQWLPLNSYKIPTFTGDKKDKQLLSICDWLSGKFICYYCLALIQTQPGDIRGKLKQKSTSLDSVLQVDEVSSTIQASIQYCDNNQTTRSTIKKNDYKNNKIV